MCVLLFVLKHKRSSIMFVEQVPQLLDVESKLNEKTVIVLELHKPRVS